MRNILFPLGFACLLFSCKKEDAILPTPTNKAPVARAGQDATIYIPEISYTLDGKESFDPDRNFIEYNWRQISGSPLDFFLQNQNQTSASLSVREEGNYEFELTVTDPSGLSSRDTVVLTVVDNFAEGKVPVINLICRSFMMPATADQVELIANAYVEDDQGRRFDIKTGFTARQILGPGGISIHDAYLDNDQTSIPIQNLTKGNYQLLVEVTRKGISAYDTSTIQVLDDTLAGKEYIFETKWATENNKVIAKTPERPGLFYASLVRKAKLFILFEDDTDWYEVDESWNANAWVYYTRNACNSSLEVVLIDDFAVYAVGRKVTIKLIYS
jgi:hypothetical protein